MGCFDGPPDGAVPPVNEAFVPKCSKPLFIWEMPTPIYSAETATAVPVHFFPVWPGKSRLVMDDRDFIGFDIGQGRRTDGVQSGGVKVQRSEVRGERTVWGGSLPLGTWIRVNPPALPVRIAKALPFPA